MDAPGDGPCVAAVKAALRDEITVTEAVKRVQGAGAVVARRRPQAERNLEVVAKQDARLHRKVANTMEAYMGAADLNDDGTTVDPQAELEPDGRPKGWSHRKYRVARDGRIPVREQPGYLTAAQRMFDSYARKETGAKAPELNVDVTVAIVSPAAQAVVGARYRVIDVEEDKR